MEGMNACLLISKAYNMHARAQQRSCWLSLRSSPGATHGTCACWGCWEERRSRSSFGAVGATAPAVAGAGLWLHLHVAYLALGVTAVRT